MTGPVEPLEVGLCSWSLGVAVDEPRLRAAVSRFGLRVVHLALGPLVDLSGSACRAAVEAYRGSPLLFSAGMIGFPGEDYTSLASIRATGGYVPDDLFEARFARTVAAGAMAHVLGLSLLSTHAGFIPERSDAAGFATMISRLRRVADALAPLGITLCLETGQETAETLAAFLSALDRPNVGVNFDPANLVLYGQGDPINAVIRLAPHIRHVHAKDARATLPPPAFPAWKGHEVPLGYGDARLDELVSVLHRVGYRGPLAIECEKGVEGRGSQGKIIALAISHLNAAKRHGAR